MNSTNFRPISILASFSMIFEKVMKRKNVSNFWTTKNSLVITNMDSECLNAELALINFMSKVHNGLNLGEKVTGMFLDIKRFMALLTITSCIKIESMRSKRGS